MIITPRKLHPFVFELCRRIVPGGVPEWVPVEPALGAEVNECFPAVAAKVRSAGGGIQHGWSIWENPGLFIEAEFHAVWVSPGGHRIDVTPKLNNASKILFLADPHETFDQMSLRRRDNQRLAVLDDPRVHQFLRLSEELHAFKEGCTDPSNPRQYLFKDKEQFLLLRKFEVCQAQAEMAMMSVDPGRNDMCRCGSGAKFKKCCAAIR